MIEIDPATIYDWREYVPSVLQATWRMVRTGMDGAAFVHTLNGLAVIVSVAREMDGKLWLHVSMSRRTRIPDYEDLKMVKDVFIGRDRTAYQVFPPAAKHINIHPYCLHLWCCIDGPVTPDFTKGGNTL